MKKNLKRMLAFVSAVIMVLTMLPVGALAETEKVETPAEQFVEQPAAEVTEQPVQPQEEATAAPATEVPNTEVPTTEKPSESPEVPEETYAITYEDGVNGEAFAAQTYYAKAGEATPAFQGTPARENWKFIGWEPAVAETVTGVLPMWPSGRRIPRISLLPSSSAIKS